MKQKQIVIFLMAAIGLLVVPIILQGFGNAWVRIADMALLYVLLALGGLCGVFCHWCLYVWADGLAAFERAFSGHCRHVSGRAAHADLDCDSGRRRAGRLAWGLAGCAHAALAR